jgi:lysophospholipase L1-like esterase
MASKKQRKTKSGVAPTAWEQFAAVSRGALSSVRPSAKSARKKRGGSRGRVVTGTQSPTQATAQALRLGRKQAEWVVAQHREAQQRRAKVVAAAKAPARAKPGGAPAGKKKAAKRVAAKAASGGGPSGSRGVLVAEGDSWFDYPFHDVLQKLDDDFGWDIENVAHRGDSVESMAYDGGQLTDFVRAIERVVRRGDIPHAILMSGGGNDVAGDAFAMLLNHRSSPVFGFNPAVLDGVVQTRIRVAYTTMLSAVTAACQSLLGAPVPILLHGYDYPVPDGRGFLGGWGPLPGPWLEPGFREKGYDDLAERVAIARDLIDRLYAMLAAVVALPAFAHVQFVDLRNALSTDLVNGRYKAWWGNELHPTQQGFRRVAGLFDARL